MTVFTEGNHWCEGIKSEANGHLSREAVTIGNSQTIVPGSVLGKLTSGGNYVAYNPDGTDGSQNACAVAMYPATTGASTTAKITVLARDCEVRASSLMWASGVEAGDITTALAALAALHIIAR